MAYVRVTIIGPTGKRFSTQVDENSSPQQLLFKLLEKMHLDPKNNYQFTLINALKVHEGAVIKVTEDRPPDPLRDWQEES